MSGKLCIFRTIIEQPFKKESKKMFGKENEFISSEGISKF